MNNIKLVFKTLLINGLLASIVTLGLATLSWYIQDGEVSFRAAAEKPAVIVGMLTFCLGLPITWGWLSED